MTDRELDALVAEEVMGYRWRANRVERSDIPRGSLFPVGKDFLVSNPENGEWKRETGKRAEAWDYFIPRYSYDISAAWYVAERFIHEVRGAEPLVIWRCFEHGPPYGPSGYRVRLGKFTGWATEVPRAICLAAVGPVETV